MLQLLSAPFDSTKAPYACQLQLCQVKKKLAQLDSQFSQCPCLELQVSWLIYSYVCPSNPSQSKQSMVHRF